MRLDVDHFQSFPVDFFLHKFADCSKPSGTDNHRKAP